MKDELSVYWWRLLRGWLKNNDDGDGVGGDEGDGFGGVDGGEIEFP